MDTSGIILNNLGNEIGKCDAWEELPRMAKYGWLYSKSTISNWGRYYVFGV